MSSCEIPVPSSRSRTPNIPSTSPFVPSSGTARNWCTLYLVTTSRLTPGVRLASSVQKTSLARRARVATPSGNSVSHALGFAFFHGVANPELAIFQQRDEAAPEAQKIGGPQHERLQKVLEIAAGAELGGNLEQLVQFVRLRMRGGVEFGVGDGDRAEAGNRRHQRLLFRGKNAVLAADRAGSRPGCAKCETARRSAFPEKPDCPANARRRRSRA